MPPVVTVLPAVPASSPTPLCETQPQVNENCESSVPANPTSFKKLESVVQYSSVESIINKFDNLKKKQRKKSAVPSAHTNTSLTSMQCEKTSNAANETSLLNSSTSSSQQQTQTTKTARLKKQPSTATTATASSFTDKAVASDAQSAGAVTSGVAPNDAASKMFALPILKINDDIVDIATAEVSLEEAVASSKSPEFLMGKNLLWFYI